MGRRRRNSNPWFDALRGLSLGARDPGLYGEMSRRFIDLGEQTTGAVGNVLEQEFGSRLEPHRSAKLAEQYPDAPDNWQNLADEAFSTGPWRRVAEQTTAYNPLTSFEQRVQGLHFSGQVPQSNMYMERIERQKPYHRGQPIPQGYFAHGKHLIPENVVTENWAGPATASGQAQSTFDPGDPDRMIKLAKLMKSGGMRGTGVEPLWASGESMVTEAGIGLGSQGRREAGIRLKTFLTTAELFPEGEMAIGRGVLGGVHEYRRVRMPLPKDFDPTKQTLAEPGSVWESGQIVPLSGSPGVDVGLGRSRDTATLLRNEIIEDSGRQYVEATLRMFTSVAGAGLGIKTGGTKTETVERDMAKLGLPADTQAAITLKYKELIPYSYYAANPADLARAVGAGGEGASQEELARLGGEMNWTTPGVAAQGTGYFWNTLYPQMETTHTLTEDIHRSALSQYEKAIIPGKTEDLGDDMLRVSFEAKGIEADLFFSAGSVRGWPGQRNRMSDENIRDLGQYNPQAAAQYREEGVAQNIQRASLLEAAAMTADPGLERKNVLDFTGQDRNLYEATMGVARERAAEVEGPWEKGTIPHDVLARNFFEVLAETEQGGQKIALGAGVLASARAVTSRMSEGGALHIGGTSSVMANAATRALMGALSPSEQERTGATERATIALDEQAKMVRSTTRALGDTEHSRFVYGSEIAADPTIDPRKVYIPEQAIFKAFGVTSTKDKAQLLKLMASGEAKVPGYLTGYPATEMDYSYGAFEIHPTSEITPTGERENFKILAATMAVASVARDSDGDPMKVNMYGNLVRGDGGRITGIDAMETIFIGEQALQQRSDALVARGRNPHDLRAAPSGEQVRQEAQTLYDVPVAAAAHTYRAAQGMTGVDYNNLGRQLAAQTHTTEESRAAQAVHQMVYAERQIPHSISDPNLREFADIFATFTPRAGSAVRSISGEGESVYARGKGVRRDTMANAFTSMFKSLTQTKTKEGTYALSTGEVAALFSGEKNRGTARNFAEALRQDPGAKYNVDMAIGLIGGAGGDSMEAMLDAPMGRAFVGSVVRRDIKRRLAKDENADISAIVPGASPAQVQRIGALVQEQRDLELTYTKTSGQDPAEVVGAIQRTHSAQRGLPKNVRQWNEPGNLASLNTIVPNVSAAAAPTAPVSPVAQGAAIQSPAAEPQTAAGQQGVPAASLTTPPEATERMWQAAASAAQQQPMAKTKAAGMPRETAAPTWLKSLDTVMQAFTGARGTSGGPDELKDAVAKLVPSITGLVKSIDGWKDGIDLAQEPTGEYTRETKKRVRALVRADADLASYARRTASLAAQEKDPDNVYGRANAVANAARQKLNDLNPNLQGIAASIKQQEFSSDLGLMPPGGAGPGGGPGDGFGLFGQAFAVGGRVGTKMMSGWGMMQINRLWGLTGGAAVADIPVAAQQEMSAAQAAMAGQPGVSAPLGPTARGLLSMQARQAAYHGTVGRTTYQAYGGGMGAMISPTVGGAVGLGAVPAGLGLTAGLLAKWGLAGTALAPAALPLGLTVAAGALTYGAINYAQDVNATDLSSAAGIDSTNLLERTAARGGQNLRAARELLGIAPRQEGSGFGGDEPTGAANVQQLAARIRSGQMAGMNIQERTATMRSFYAGRVAPGGVLNEQLGYLKEEQFMAGASQYMAYIDETNLSAMADDPMFEALARGDVDTQQLSNLSLAFGGRGTDIQYGYGMISEEGAGLTPTQAAMGMTVSGKYMQPLTAGPHAAMSRRAAGTMFGRMGKLGIGEEGTRTADLLTAAASGDMETVSWAMDQSGLGWMQPAELPMQATSAGRMGAMHIQHGFQTQQRNIGRAYQQTQFGFRQQGIDLSYQGAMAQAGIQMERLQLSYRQTMGDEPGTPDGYVGRFGWREQQMGLQHGQFMGNWALQGAMMGENQSWQRTQQAWQGQALERNWGRTLAQRGWEDTAIDQGQERQQTQYGWQIQGLQISQEMAGISRAGTQAGWAYSAERGALQFGWQQEDTTENIRYASGRQRKQLMTQQERATTLYNMEQGQAGESQDRQQELWELEDQRFDMRREQIEEQQKWAEEDYTTSEEHREEKRKWEDEDHKIAGDHLTEQKKHTEVIAGLQNAQHAQSLKNHLASHALQMAQMGEEKKAFEEQHDLNIRAAGVSAGLAAQQRDLAQAGLDAAILHTGQMNALSDAQNGLAYEEGLRMQQWINFLRDSIPRLLMEMMQKKLDRLVFPDDDLPYLPE